LLSAIIFFQHKRPTAKTIQEASIHLFENAFKQRDLAKIQEITTLSKEEEHVLKDIFDAYSNFDIAVTEPIITNEGATAVVEIQSVLDGDGNTVIPGPWKEIQIHFPKGLWGGKLELEINKDKK
jgi:hypothetical protein